MSRDILVIEDNERNLYLVRFLLENGGFSVRTARDGAEGIEAAMMQAPDMVLLDIQLPSMDGYTVAQALRAEHKLRHVPIVAVTSYAMPGDREKAMRVGFSAYIEKPIDPTRFVDQIRQLFV